MKKTILKMVITYLAGLGTLFALQSNASAASQYSATRAHEVKLIWRRTMGRHAFTAPTGARFSKHLGTRYGYNTETKDVTWYTDAHEKLYLTNLHMDSIYYHVTNSDQSLQGWIWKGYLKPVDNDSSTTNSGNGNSSTNGNGDSSSSSTGNKKEPNNGSDNIYSGALGNTATSDLDKQVDDLFPGTVHDKKIDLYISLGYSNNSFVDPINSASFNKSVTDETGLTTIKTFSLNNQIKRPVSLENVKAALTAQGADFNQYNGYHIGAIVFPENVGFGVGNPGDGMVILGK